MKKKNFYIILLLLSIILFPFSNPTVTFAEEQIKIKGTGMRETPYEITNEKQLIALAENKLPTGAYYILKNNITLKSNNWKPIEIFDGVFNGNGYVIKNLKVKNSSTGGGFFADNWGVIRNLGLEDVNVSSSRNTGGLVGYNNGTIEKCYTTGKVVGTSKELHHHTGGLVGLNTGRILNSYSMATTFKESGGKAGGLIGSNLAASPIQYCYATGKVTYVNVDGQAGGLSGDSLSNRIHFSYYDESTTGCDDTAKGIPLISAQMKDISNFENWDTKKVWDQNPKVNNGYPFLKIFQQKKKPKDDITSASKKVSIATASCSVINNQIFGSPIYGNSEITPQFYLTLNGNFLLEDDYTVTYKNNKSPGRATMIIKGRGYCNGKLLIDFIIVPQNVKFDYRKEAEGTSLSLNWEKDKFASGFEVQCATTEDFLSPLNTITIENNTDNGIDLATLSDQEFDYVRVRAYILIDGIKYYGNYSTSNLNYYT